MPRSHGKSGAVAEANKAGKTYEGLSRQQLVEAYRLMYTSRRLDDREIMLKRQQKIFFLMPAAGDLEKDFMLALEHDLAIIEAPPGVHQPISFHELLP